MAKDKITNDPHRAALAAAIAEHDAARRRLVTARLASANAETEMYEAYRTLDVLLEVVNAAPDSMLEVLAAGGAVDVNVLERPAAEARKAENDIASWRRVHDIAEKTIPDRQRAVEYATRKVDSAARGVIGSSCDIGKLVADAEIAAAAIIDQRSRLMNLRTHLDGDANAAVDNFLARPWLIHEMNGDWMNHPAAAQYRDAHAALMRDAEAPLPA